MSADRARAEAPAERASARAASWLVALGLCLLVLATYQRVRGAGFIWDDDDYVERNELLVAPDGLAQIWNPRSPHNPQYYPLVFTTFRLERALWGLDPTGYHVVNVLLHAANAVLLFLLLSRVGLRFAWLVAAVFAVHPVHVESVAWITERKNVLSGLFYLLAAHAFLSFHGRRAGSTRWWLYALTLACFCLALSAKTVTASLPIALAALLWWKEGKLAARTLAALAPLLVIGFAMGMLTRAHEARHVLAAGSPLEALTPPDRLLIAGRALWFYPWKLAWPADLAFIYERWRLDLGSLVQWLFPLGALAVALGLVALARRGRLARGVLAALVFYAATIFPALGFVNVAPMRFSFVADHFQYLASIGPILLGAAGLAWLVERGAGATIAAGGDGAPRALAAVGLAWVLVLAFLAARQTRVYDHLGTLWADTAAKSSHNPMVLNSYANWLRKQHDADPARAAELDQQAARYCEQALQYAAPASEEALLATCNLSSIRFDQGRHGEALAQAEAALATHPDFPGALKLKGQALFALGRGAEAEQAFQRLLAQQVDAAAGRAAWDIRRRIDERPVHLMLGMLQSQDGRLVEALASYEAVLAQDPAHRAAHAGRVGALLGLARFGALIAALEDASARAADPLAFRLQLAWYLAVLPDASVRDGARALALARELCGDTPEPHPLAASAKAAALAETGDLAGALALAESALARARSAGPQAAQVAAQLEGQVADYRAGRPTRLNR